MMRRRWWVSGAAVLVIVTTAGGLVLLHPQQAAPATKTDSVNTASVERGDLAAMVSANGTLTYGAQADGSPYSAINQAHGIYTKLPNEGDEVRCGDVLYQVDDKPVLLLCGDGPAFRSLHVNDAGNDVVQLNQNLHVLGYDAGLAIDPTGTAFTWKTRSALEKLQRAKGLDATGVFGIDSAVFLPASVRVAQVMVKLGGSAQAGTPLLDATSNTPEVQMNLDPSQQSDVHKGDVAHVTLPDNTTVAGRVDRIGPVARVADAKDTKDASAGSVSIPVHIRLDDPDRGRALDKAPVRVNITTKGVEGILSVPVTAIVGKSGGGYAVEVVHDGGGRDLIPVDLGLFDTTGGRVEVRGDVHGGDHVVVPSL
jgi:multidrug efflux pump subunit AcrA (membrane-fusion protein)